MIDVVEDTTYNNSMFDIFFNNVVLKNIFYLKIYYNNIFIFLKSSYSNNIKNKCARYLSEEPVMMLNAREKITT